MQLYKLKELYSISSGLSKSASQFGYGNPFLSFHVVFNNYHIPNTLIDLVNTSPVEVRRFSIKRGDVFVTRTSEKLDEVGISCVALQDYEKATFNGFCKRLRPIVDENIILPEYAQYLFRSKQFTDQIIYSCPMSTRASLNEEILNTIVLNVHSLREQQHIVDIIGSIDDKIENNNKLYDKIEDYLLLEYKKLNKKIPESIFKDNFDILNGYSFKSKDYCKNGEYKVITIKNIKIDGFTTNSCDYINFNDKYQKVKLNIGDILLTMTGDVGRVGIVDQENCLLNQRVLKVSGISKAFTYIFLKSNYTNISMISKGSVQQNLSVNDLYNLKVNNSKQQIEDFRKYDLLFDKMILLKIENVKLQQLKLDYLAKFF